LISEDLDEIFAISDRIAVIYEGQIMGVFPCEEADLATVGLLMAGGSQQRPSEKEAA
jgi:general nucleoside transport system ATP-binding protein